MDTFAADWLLALSEREDELFQHPRVDVPSLDHAITRIVLAPAAVFESMEEVAEKHETYAYRYQCGPSSFCVYMDSFQIWLDVSDCSPGSGGSAIYAAVASFAHSRRYCFIGDPKGLSDMALRRRTDAMLSSALKYRCSSHLRPHARQLEGDHALGVQPLVWTADTTANVQNMINVAVESLTFDVPEVADAYYDFDKKTFCDASGGSLLEPVLGSWGDHLARSGKTRAGIATLKRGILLRSLVRQESEARSALLEQVLRESSEFIDHGDLSGIFY